MATRVPRRRSESHESEVARGNFSELVSAHRGRVTILTETSFLGLDRERPWSMSVVLVSTGKAWICVDLIS